MSAIVFLLLLVSPPLGAGPTSRPPVEEYRKPEEEPHVRNSMNLRIVHRRVVSHLVHEVRGNVPVVTLILTHGPNYWAFKSNSHALYAPCGAPDNCVRLMKKIDAHLRKGATLGLSLDGSFVRRIIFFGTEPSR